MLTSSFTKKQTFEQTKYTADKVQIVLNIVFATKTFIQPDLTNLLCKLTAVDGTWSLCCCTCQHIQKIKFPSVSQTGYEKKLHFILFNLFCHFSFLFLLFNLIQLKEMLLSDLLCQRVVMRFLAEHFQRDEASIRASEGSCHPESQGRPVGREFAVP